MKKCMVVFIYMAISGYFYPSKSDVLVHNAAFLGTQANERVGYVLSSAGDVNGDHFDDFLIGTFHHNTGGVVSDAGAVFLILGREHVSDWGMNYSLPNADAIFLGRNWEAVGFSVAAGGDVNGDGYDDIIIGAPAGNERVRTWQGWIYVVLGKQTADWGREFYLQNQADGIYQGEAGEDLAGRSVAVLDDLNGDGCDEILCSAPYHDLGATDAGKVYLILGKRVGWNKNDKLRLADASFYYPRADALCGYSLADIGDVNDDGTADFAIGAEGINRVFVMYGRKKVNWGLNFNLENADLILEPEDRLKGDAVGYKVAGVGDVNGDAVDDFLISAIEFNKKTITLGYGKVYLLLGRSGGWGYSPLPLTQADASFIGEHENDQAGYDIGGTGDIDGDGFNDFLIGAWLNDQGYQDAGKVYAIYGKATGWQRNVQLSSVTSFFSGEDSVNYAGYATKIVGDIDGDQRDDLAISAPYYDGFSKHSGKIYLFASQDIKRTISGSVTYHFSQYPIPNTKIMLTGSQSDIALTDTQGLYETKVAGNQNYYLTPVKSLGEDVGFGSVSAFDAALVARHSVRLHSLENDVQAIADVNKDGRITSYDAALILKYSLGYPSQANSYAGEWIFSPVSLFISDISENMADQNFSALVRGDVNLDWISNQPIAKLVEESSPLVTCTRLADDELILTIRINDYKQAVSFDLHISYPAEKLQFFAISQLSSTHEFVLDSYDNGSGVLKIGAYRLRPIDLSGECLEIKFKVYDSKNILRESIAIEKFRLNDRAFDGSKILLQGDYPVSFQLSQNYPNPFNGTTRINYRIEEPGIVAITICDIMGGEVFSFREEKKDSGTYQFAWNGRNRSGQHVSSGLYICRASFGDIKQQIKLLYIQ